MHSSSITVLHSTRCVRSSLSYGGNNRSQQIVEVLANHGIRCRTVNLFPNDLSERTENFLAGARILAGSPERFPLSYHTAWIAGRYSRILQRELEEEPNAKRVLIWENTEDGLLAAAAKHIGIQVVALPHDLVALNRGAPSNRLKRFARELNGLAIADARFTISSEESWLLRVLDMKTDHFPYFPSNEYCQKLRECRIHRHFDPDAPVLILGSATNPQTQAGIAQQINWVKRVDRRPQRTFIVAGNGTDCFSAEADNGLHVLGGIEEHELFNLLCRSVALWCHQEAGTGALTRIIESLIAGLPVITTGMAARSTVGLQGIYPIANFEDVQTTLDQMPLIAPEPSPPSQAEQNLALYVKGLSTGRDQDPDSGLPPSISYD